MKLWIVRFVMYGGAHSIDGYFRSEQAARDVYEAKAGHVRFCDDFGIEATVDTRQCAILLTNTESSAAFQAALSSANAAAARTYGLSAPTFAKGSTVQ